MTEAALHDVLRESVDEVLERMFFVCPCGERREARGNDGEIAAQLTFEGEPSGGLKIRLPFPSARSIAADFLGEEAEALPESRIGEVVCELANMICGSFLSRLESGAPFRLSTPQIVTIGGLPLQDEASIAHAVELTEGTLSVLIHIERQACQTLAASES